MGDGARDRDKGWGGGWGKGWGTGMREDGGEGAGPNKYC